MTLTVSQKHEMFSYFRTLSWVRVRDGHILTVDHETFISDPRFSSLPLQQNNIWTLQVRTVFDTKPDFKQLSFCTQI